LRQPRILLQPSLSILNEVLIVQNLEKHHIHICKVVANNKWPAARQVGSLQVCLDSLQESCSVALAVVWVVLFLVVGEEG
jgi:hypothetical protein